MAFHQGAEHGTRAAGSGVGTPVAGADGRVASEWVERQRVLAAVGINRADVSLLEAGAVAAGCGGIDYGHEFRWSATEKSSALRRMALNILQQDTTV